MATYDAVIESLLVTNDEALRLVCAYGLRQERPREVDLRWLPLFDDDMAPVDLKGTGIWREAVQRWKR